MQFNYSDFNLDSLKIQLNFFDFKMSYVYNVRVTNIEGNIITYFPFTLSEYINNNSLVEYLFHEINDELGDYFYSFNEINKLDGSDNYFYIHIHVKKGIEVLNDNDESSEFRYFVPLKMKEGKVIEE
jgi:hypothetical protein